MSMEHKNNSADVLILPEENDGYIIAGTMTAIFKVDENETNEKYSIS